MSQTVCPATALVIDPMARQSKGPRVYLLATRVHPDVAKLVEAEARRRGVPKSDVLSHALCLLYDKPECDPLRESSGAEQLPMTG